MLHLSGIPDRNNYWDPQPGTATAGQLVISEFRLRGPNVANPATDEFIEIYNASGASHTVAAASGTGLRRCQLRTALRDAAIPNGTVIPSQGTLPLCQ